MWRSTGTWRSPSGQPVLDVGCATGRLILTYLEEGIDADGVDVSPEMLAIVPPQGGRTGP